MNKWRALAVFLLCLAIGVAFAAPAPMPPSAVVLIGALGIGGVLASARGERA
ncbi:hypothetical protein [Demequina capsici]|uniref:XapX domain-containing protein n=1 Tax=Demequina capsici TaxID=3075620 RepID=A0AA96F9D5_9MICO|nr:hypothetical protein [Demequina sp. OYTSA14]WNM25232.1 hypothetical protein RN606_03535 [Demequina sp. OYTSA14]